MSDQTHDTAETVRNKVHSTTDRTVNQAENAAETTSETIQSGAQRARSLYVAVRDSDEVRRLRSFVPAAAFGAAIGSGNIPVAVGLVAEEATDFVTKRVKARRRSGDTPKDKQ